MHKGLEVQRAGGVAFILANSPNEGKDIECDAHVIPSTSVALHDTERLIHYIRSSHNPMVRILPGSTSLNATPAPAMTFFSGRGPNPLDPNFIKVSNSIDIYSFRGEHCISEIMNDMSNVRCNKTIHV